MKVSEQAGVNFIHFRRKENTKRKVKRWQRDRRRQYSLEKMEKGREKPGRKRKISLRGEEITVGEQTMTGEKTKARIV